MMHRMLCDFPTSILSILFILSQLKRVNHSDYFRSKP